MNTFDWDKLHEATSRENRPTPGLLLRQISQDACYAKPCEYQLVAKYLAECVDGSHVHVKLKALFVIKAIAYRVPPFCKVMQEHLTSIQSATTLTGPPSPTYGDEPYRLVREAANSAFAILTKNIHYDEEHRDLSQRIVGFGNYIPDQDVLTKDSRVRYQAAAKGAVELIWNGVCTAVGGTRDLLTSQLQHEAASIARHNNDPDGSCGADKNVDSDDEFDMEEDKDGAPNVCEPSRGDYVPPVLGELELVAETSAREGLNATKSEVVDAAIPGNALFDIFQPEKGHQVQEPSLLELLEGFSPQKPNSVPQQVETDTAEN